MKAPIFITCSLFALPSLSGMQEYTPEKLNEELVSAAYRGDLRCVKIFICLRADVNYQQHDNPRYTPLLAAACDARTELCKFLIERHANVNAIDENGNTPLMHTIKAKGLYAFKALLEAGANPNLINKKGKTALILASHYAHPVALELLLPLAIYTPPAPVMQRTHARIITIILSLKRLSFSKDIRELIISYLDLDVARLVVANMAREIKFPVLLLNQARRKLPQLTIEQIKNQIKQTNQNLSDQNIRKNLLQVDSFEEKYGAIIREGIAKRFGK